MRYFEIIPLNEAAHTAPTWKYSPGGDEYAGHKTARIVQGSFVVDDPQSQFEKWPYLYGFTWGHDGSVEVFFELDNHAMVDLVYRAKDAGKITDEEAKPLIFRYQLVSPTILFNSMGANVARTVLRIMGDLTVRFVAEYSPEKLIMVAESDRRLSIYEKLMRKLPGYDIAHEKNKRGNGHIIVATRS